MSGATRGEAVSDIADLPTGPIPAQKPDPLVLLVDGNPQRRRWVFWLLVVAHYRVQAQASAQETLTWYMEHMAMPRVLLLGSLPMREALLTQQLIVWMNRQRGEDLVVISLDDFPAGSARRFFPNAADVFLLLKTLWLVTA